MSITMGADDMCMSIWGEDCPSGEGPIHACEMPNGHGGACICVDCGRSSDE